MNQNEIVPAEWANNPLMRISARMATRAQENLDNGNVGRAVFGTLGACAVGVPGVFLAAGKLITDAYREGQKGN